MILAMVFGRPDVSRFLNEITADDFLLWAEFYNRSPWGPTRDDQRQAVLLSYLVKAFIGGDSETPNLTFPYFSKSLEDQEAMLKLAVETDAALEDDGRGGYRWKGGQKPRALVEIEEKLDAERKAREAEVAPRLW